MEKPRVKIHQITQKIKGTKKTRVKIYQITRKVKGTKKSRLIQHP